MFYKVNPGLVEDKVGVHTYPSFVYYEPIEVITIHKTLEEYMPMRRLVGPEIEYYSLNRFVGECIESNKAILAGKEDSNDRWYIVDNKQSVDSKKPDPDILLAELDQAKDTIVYLQNMLDEAASIIEPISKHKLENPKEEEFAIEMLLEQIYAL